MATYAIGDIHGCYDQLQQLLSYIKFDPLQDTLWFTGDLVNGGPHPAETIRFIKDLGERAICVLGNHDIALLAIAAGAFEAPKDRNIGYEPILEAPDCAELIDWLRLQRIAHYDPKFNALLVHAGILPTWDLETVQRLSREVENTLRSKNIESEFDQIFGDINVPWHDKLIGYDRIKYLVNCFTRLRFCTQDGMLDYNSKSGIGSQPAGYLPWFAAPHRLTKDVNIIFGHWSTLNGNTGIPNVYAIDTGCVWGQSLTAIRLDDWTTFSVNSSRTL